MTQHKWLPIDHDRTAGTVFKRHRRDQSWSFGSGTVGYANVAVARLGDDMHPRVHAWRLEHLTISKAAPVFEDVLRRLERLFDVVFSSSSNGQAGGRFRMGKSCTTRKCTLTNVVSVSTAFAKT
eukprot:TRINITY_DN14714_c0_g5_i1.p2 TRINITY_DN14714_c0_g5~~TRINITY_DN14714_c0_g5_i1.p2  ORF type:complete len:124 (+),score=7.45 TRINITY_DN14714_c0_g5_i1:434-805(+)